MYKKVKKEAVHRVEIMPRACCFVWKCKNGCHRRQFPEHEVPSSSNILGGGREQPFASAGAEPTAACPAGPAGRRAEGGEEDGEEEEEETER